MSMRLVRRLLFSGGIILLALSQVNFPWVEDAEIFTNAEDPVKGEGYFGIAQDPWQWSTTQNWEDGSRETNFRSARACGHPSMIIDVAYTDGGNATKFDLGGGSCGDVSSGGQKAGYGIICVMLFSFGAGFTGYIGGRKAIRASRFAIVLLSIFILVWWYAIYPWEQSYPEVDPVNGDARTLELEMELAEGFWMAASGTGLILLNVILMGPRR